MVEVLLFAPSDREIYGKIDLKKIDADTFPLGIAYIASFIRSNGHSVKLVDVKLFGNEWKQKITDIVKGEKPSFIGISCVTPAMPDALRIAETVKSVDKNIKIVLGGPHPSAIPEECISYENVDIVCVGEGEYTFLDLLEGKELSKIKGLCYIEKGKIKVTPPRDLISDLDSLPWPAYDLLPIHSYGNPFLGKSIIMVTGRGCPYNCLFCSSKTINRQRYRLRSVKNVVDEIEYLYKNYNLRGFLFADDTFTMIPKRTEELCNEIMRRGLKISWGCDTRVDAMTPELARLMKSSGCNLVKLGIESGDEKILKIIRKGITLDQVRRAVKIVNAAGIKAHGFFIIGHPYDTEESVRRTIDFAKSLPLDYAQFSVLTPYPGTDVLDMAKRKEGIELLSSDWGKFRRYDKPIIRLDTLSPEQLERLHGIAYQEFYMRPSYMVKRLFSTKPAELFGLAGNAFALLRFIRLSKRNN